MAPALRILDVSLGDVVSELKHERRNGFQGEFVVITRTTRVSCSSDDCDRFFTCSSNLIRHYLGCAGVNPTHCGQTMDGKLLVTVRVTNTKSSKRARTCRVKDELERHNIRNYTLIDRLYSAGDSDKMPGPTVAAPSQAAAQPLPTRATAARAAAQQPKVSVVIDLTMDSDDDEVVPPAAAQRPRLPTAAHHSNASLITPAGHGHAQQTAGQAQHATSRPAANPARTQYAPMPHVPEMEDRKPFGDPAAENEAHAEDLLAFLTRRLQRMNIAAGTIQALANPINKLAEAGLQPSILNRLTRQMYENAFDSDPGLSSVLPFHRAALLSCIEPLLRKS